MPLPHTIQIHAELNVPTDRLSSVCLFYQFCTCFSFRSVHRLTKFFCFVCFWRGSPPLGHGPLIHEVSRSHTTSHHRRQDSSGLVISSSQRPVPDNTQHSQQTNIHAPRWDSNPQSQQASGRRPAPQTARPLGPASSNHVQLEYLHAQTSASKIVSNISSCAFREQFRGHVTSAVDAEFFRNYRRTYMETRVCCRKQISKITHKQQKLMLSTHFIIYRVAPQKCIHYLLINILECVYTFFGATVYMPVSTIIQGVRKRLNPFFIFFFQVPSVWRVVQVALIEFLEKGTIFFGHSV